MNKKKTSSTLVLCLAMVMFFLFLGGFFLQRTVFLGNEMYKETPIPALPFIFLFDDGYHAQLQAERAAETAVTETSPAETEADPEPGAETGGDSLASGTAEQTGPVLTAVTEEYFYDTLFIGDSRTEGLYLYSPLEGADYFCTRGMTVFNVFETTSRQSTTKLEDLLSEKDYGEIYIMLGINEVGTNFTAVIEQYRTVLERLRELEPGAILVIQGNLSVSAEKSKDTWYLTAKRISDLNRMQAALADGENIFYIDANDIFCDSDGYLIEELSGDGVHLYAKNYAVWSEWLLNNAYVLPPKAEETEPSQEELPPEETVAESTAEETVDEELVIIY